MELTHELVNSWLKERGRISIAEAQLEIMLSDNETKEAEIKLLYDSIVDVFEVLGLAENRKIKTEAFAEGGNALKEVLKGGSEIMRLAIQAGMPIIGKNAEKELAEKFGFFKKLLPLINKYSEVYG